jgi:replication factor C subunit 2/4
MENKNNFLILDSFDIKDKNNNMTASLPWIEKYRPKLMTDIISHTNIISSLKISLENNNLPHLLFYGPPGTGKTSTILAMGRELFGIELMKERIIELNASDDRGINAVRDKIKLYAMSTIGNSDEYKERTNGKYPCPSYKIIVLDEADSMTKDAQSALRKIMENYSHITRFCFICNYKNKIIGPIASRCVQYGFLPLNKELIFSKLSEISKNEKIECDIEIIDKIVELCDGDMRKAIMMLQNLKYIQQTLKYTDININHIIELNGYIQEAYLDKIIFKLKNKTFDDNITSANNIIYKGYSIDNFLNQFLKKIISDNDISDMQKSKISIHFSDNQMKIINGSDESLQILDIIMYSYMVINNEL